MSIANIKISNPPASGAALTTAAALLVVGEDGSSYRTTIEELRALLLQPVAVEFPAGAPSLTLPQGALHFTITSSAQGAPQRDGYGRAIVHIPTSTVGYFTVRNDTPYNLLFRNAAEREEEQDPQTTSIYANNSQDLFRLM